MPSIYVALSLLVKSYQRRASIMNSYILHKQRNCIISRYLTRFLVQLGKGESAGIMPADFCILC